MRWRTSGYGLGILSRRSLLAFWLGALVLPFLAPFFRLLVPARPAWAPAWMSRDGVSSGLVRGAAVSGPLFRAVTVGDLERMLLADLGMSTSTTRWSCGCLHRDGFWAACSLALSRQAFRQARSSSPSWAWIIPPWSAWRVHRGGLPAEYRTVRVTPSGRSGKPRAAISRQNSSTSCHVRGDGVVSRQFRQVAQAPHPRHRIVMSPGTGWSGGPPRRTA